MRICSFRLREHSNEITTIISTALQGVWLLSEPKEIMATHQASYITFSYRDSRQASALRDQNVTDEERKIAKKESAFVPDVRHRSNSSTPDSDSMDRTFKQN